MRRCVDGIFFPHPEQGGWDSFDHGRCFTCTLLLVCDSIRVRLVIVETLGFSAAKGMADAESQEGSLALTHHVQYMLAGTKLGSKLSSMQILAAGAAGVYY